MTKYNMIKNSSFFANTASGTGNKTLTNLELSYLIDDQLLTGGVSVIDSDVLYLEVDLGYRLKVDSILLYADDLNVLTNINFYYKNDSADSFTICTKAVSSVSYVATVPNPSAPRFIRCTISGVNLQIYELQLLNNDNIIAFGEDGSLTDTFLTDTPEGAYGEVQAIEIYNDNTSDIPANAYVCVDYTGQVGDAYVDIAADVDGPFYNIMDGDVIKSLWSRGTHDNTTVSNTADGSVLILSKATPYEHLEPDYIGVLPEVNCNYPTKPAGVRQYVTYDKINKKVYMAFWPGTTYNGSSFILWCYDILSNTWIYRGTLVSSLWDVYSFTLCCDATYVYFMAVPTNISSTTRTILKHDVAGSLGNLTTFTTFTASRSDLYYYFMIADFNGNIWIKNHHAYQSPPSKAFFRLNTTTLVLTTMSNTFLSVESTVSYSVLTHDDIRNRIYCLYVNGTAHNNYYIEMYDIATDIWTTQYFNYGSRILANCYDLHMSCYNEAFYFQSANYAGKIYKYDLNTGILSILPVNVVTKTGILNKIIAFAPVGLDDTVSLLVFTGSTNEYAFFGYNLPQILDNNVPNLLHISGVYTSTILALPDANKASYFRIDTLTTPGTTNVSKDKTYQDGIIEVRSSDTSPLPVDHVFWVMQALAYSKWYRIYYDNNTAGSGYPSIVNLSNVSAAVYGSSTSRRSGKQLYIYATFSSSTTSAAVVLDFDGNLTFTKSTTTNLYYYGNTKYCGFEFNDGFWTYDNTGKYLRHFGNTGDFISEIVMDGLIGLAPDFTSTGAWYLNSISKAAVHVTSAGETDVTIAIGSPIHMCITETNGCWVIDHADVEFTKVINKYSSSGELLITIPITKNFKTISSDLLGGFYVLSYDNEQSICHYDKEGNLTMELGGLSTDDYISGSHYGVLLYSTTLKRTRYVSLATGAILWTKFYTDFFTTSSYTATFYPTLFSLRIEDQQSDSGVPKFIPRSYESLWGSDSTSLPWREVDKDGYFLTKNKYQQVRLTLWNFDGVSTPTVTRIIMAPAIEIKDIPPNQSKPFYIRSNIPNGYGDTPLDTRIKVWWDLEVTS